MTMNLYDVPDDPQAPNASAPCHCSELRRETLQAACRAANGQLPDTHGFILLVAPFGDGTGECEAQYASSMSRDDAIKILKTLLFRWGVNEEWMNNLK